MGGRGDRDRVGRTPWRRAALPDRDREPERAARGASTARRPRGMGWWNPLPPLVEEGGARDQRRERQPARRDPGQPLRVRWIARVTPPAPARVWRRDRARRRPLRRPAHLPRGLAI